MDPAMMRRLTAVKYNANKNTKGAFGKHGIKEIEYQYKDIYQKKSKRTGTMLTGKTRIGY